MATEPDHPSINRSSDPFQLDRRLTILETRFDTVLPTLATKADLAELKVDFKTELHTEISQLTRWLVALTVSMLFGFAGMIITMITLLRH